MGFASVAVVRGVVKPTRYLCVREVQNSIRESVHRTLADRIQDLGYGQYYEIQRDAIYGVGPALGTEFIFAGIKNDPGKIKSFANADVCWIEEAQNVEEASWRILIPTIRGRARREGDTSFRMMSEIWLTLNPTDEDLPKGYTYQHYVIGKLPDCRRVEINFDDNPWFPEELELERQSDLERIKDAPDEIGKIQLQARYDHVWGGKPLRFPAGAFFTEAQLLVDGKPIEMPTSCDVVYVTVDSAMKSTNNHDGLAVAYWARSQHVGHPLVLLDWDLRQIDGALLPEYFPSVLKRANELANQCRARVGSKGALIEDKSSGTILIQHGMKNGWPVKAIPSKFTSLGKSERGFAVSEHVHAGKVKMTQLAFDKIVTYHGVSKNHMLSQVTGFSPTIANDMKEDDAYDAFVYGVAMGLGSREGF